MQRSYSVLLQPLHNLLIKSVFFKKNRSKRISQNFDEEIPLIKEKFLKADYPLRFINSVVNEFQKGKECGDESFIIPPSLFENTKPFIFTEIPYCEPNKIKSKRFLKIFHKFTNNSLVTILDSSIRSLFSLQDKKNYKSCVIYKGVCSCGMQKLDGMKIIIQRKVQNHQNTFDATSTTVLHGLSFQMLQKNAKNRKKLEASYIALWKPDLNEQKYFERLVSFRNGAT